MTSTIVERKTLVRQSMLARRAEHSPEQRQAAAFGLARHAEAIIRMAEGRVISGFTPFRDEIDPLPLLGALSDAGLALAMPRVAGRHLTFHVWRPGDPLVRGKFGQPEPEAHMPELHPGLMMVPLLAFDRCGQRLGYGGGFFDRVIADHAGIPTIGVAYAMQEVPAVPTEPHDQPLSHIATDAELIDCRAERGQ